MRTLIVAMALTGAACARKPSREEVCKVALDEFRRSAAQPDPSLDPEQAQQLREMIERATPKFMDYCRSLSETDIGCLSHIEERMDDPACQQTIQDTQSKLLGM